MPQTTPMPQIQKRLFAALFKSACLVNALFEQRGIGQAVDNKADEAGSVGAVDHAVVVAEAERQHLAPDDLAVGAWCCYRADAGDA